MDYKGLTPDQLKKVKECKTADELAALARSEGVELSDEQLEKIAGGAQTLDPIICPNCGSKDIALDMLARRTSAMTAARSLFSAPPISGLNQ